jgi:hypothetical protein
MIIGIDDQNEKELGTQVEKGKSDYLPQLQEIHSMQ